MKAYVNDFGIKNPHVNLFCPTIGKSQLFRNWLPLFLPFAYLSMPLFPFCFFLPYVHLDS